MKCRNSNCQNEKAIDRAECHSCRGKRRRGTSYITKWKSDENSPKILFIDIETYPNLCLVWDSQLFHGGIGVDQIVEEGGLLCFSAKWYGQEDILFYSRWNDGDQAMKEAAWRLMDEADIIVHYYGSRFDVPHLNEEFLKVGLFPPTPFKQVDLKLAVARRFKLPSNKLQFVSRVLGLEGKEEHEGFRLWSKIYLFDDKDAKDRMESYNKRDTVLLEECYESLLPWLPDHPHRHLYGGNGGCPRCGHDGSMIENGYAYTKVSKYLQYRCTMCGSSFRDAKRIEGVQIQDSVL